jgi:NAD(P)H-dependent FMN reductase
MNKIVIISSSVREGRKSHRVALFFKQFIESNKLGKAEILDLMAYSFPVFEERMKFQKEPSADVHEFAGKIEKADGVIIVTPEYNGGYPASLKNAIDLLVDQWKRKPVAFSTVSGGVFGGMNVIPSLQFVLWKMGALTVPAMFPVAKIGESFDEQGNPADKEGTEKRATRFMEELSWCMEAKRKMQA